MGDRTKILSEVLKSEVRGQKSKVRSRRSAACPSVAAGLALGYEDGRAGAAPARPVGKGVQDAGYRGVGREDSQHYDGDGCKGNDESNQ